MDGTPTYEQLQQRIALLEKESEQSQRFEKINSTLFEISNAINTTSSIDELYKTIHLALSSIIDTTNFYIASYDKVHDLVTFPYIVDTVDTNYSPVLEVSNTASLTAEVIRTGSPVMTTKSDILALQYKSGLQKPCCAPAEIWLGVPLKHLGEIVGVMAVQNYDNTLCYDQTDMKVMVAVADQVAIAVEWKQTEKALKESEIRFRKLLQEIPSVSVQGYKLDGTTLFWNQASERLYGYNAEEAIGRNLLDLIIPPEMKGDVEQAIQGMAETGVPIPASELSLMRKNGSSVSIFSSYAIVEIPGREPELFRIDIDLTEKKQAEEEKQRLQTQLQQAQKMESLGLLAGGVAHDLNNILSGVVSYPELILMEISSENKLRRPIEIMYQSGQRATAIVQDLLTVARGVAIAKESINVNAIVQDYLLSPDFRTLQQYHKDILIEVDLAEDLLPIKGSQVHVRKILMNLISNGCEAIETSGNVLICTANTYVDGPFLGYDDVEQGEYVVLSIVDKGGGISEDDLERIFEPFYSKKVMGRSGTGLGLAVVWNVVEDHSGFINVISNDQGTTFNVYLPVTSQQVTNPEEALEITEISGDGQSILVIDDVESQRYITTSILNKLGYKTESVASGEEAVSFLEKGSMDLIVLDMIMDPGMNGRQTYEAILHLTPNQKAVIVSGFAETEEVKKTLMMGAHCYLKKPLKIQDLGIAVRQALQSD